MLLAIDPGMSGGFAWQVCGPEVQAISMPSTDRDIVDFLNSFVKGLGEFTAVIEDVPWVVGTRVSPASTAKLHRNVGLIHGALHAFGARIELVRPAEWQRFFSLGRRKDYPGSQWKNRLKQEAQRRYPGVKVTLDVADALLILEWARMRGEART